MSVTRVLLAACAAASVVQAAAAQSLVSSHTNYLALDDVEITPDSRYAVVRQNNAFEIALVFDLATGQQIGTIPTAGDLAGDVVDAVALTNDRAIVLGGSTCEILDLTQVGTPGVLLSETGVGFRPNDVAITPDGHFAAVRGGSSGPSGLGGQFIFNLANGALVAHAPGEPPLYDYFGTGTYSYDTDSVAVTNEHAVMLSIIGQTSANPLTRVTIWRLNGLAGPTVVFETGTTGPGGAADLMGAPHDIAITPDGTHAVVRSELAIAEFNLTGTPALQWVRRPFQGPGPFEDVALDSVEVSNSRIVTISNVTNPLLPEGTQVDVFDIAGNQHYDRATGTPHDLAITPDGTRAVVRTTARVLLYDLTVLPAGQLIPAAASMLSPSSTDGYQEGFDSVAVNNRYAVTLTHTADLQSTDVWFWSIARGQLDFLAKHRITDSRPTDLTITPDSNKVVVSGNSSIDVFHLATGGLAFEHKPIGANVWYQWCDGVAATNRKAVGIGQDAPSSGWIDIVDMTPISQSYCTATPNSTGQIASISALGNAHVSANSLKLAVEGVPPRAHGRFVYGAGQTQIPFGDGVQCITSPAYGLRFLDANAAGAAFLSVNYGAQALPAAMITPGSTWNFQFIYTDAGSLGFGVNSSNALSITFAP